MMYATLSVVNPLKSVAFAYMGDGVNNDSAIESAKHYFLAVNDRNMREYEDDIENLTSDMTPEQRYDVTNWRIQGTSLHRIVSIINGTWEGWTANLHSFASQD